MESAKGCTASEWLALPPLSKWFCLSGWMSGILQLGLLIYLLPVVPPVEASLIAASKISYCTNTGDEPVSCVKKMVVTLTVDANQEAGTESVVVLSTADDETSSTGTETSRFAPITLTAARSAVQYRYPLFYVQNYNAKPYEATVQGKLLNQCNADFNVNTATCGVARDASGNLIPHSQGFCCDCGMCATLGFCEAGARANNACNVFDRYTSASCLRFGPRWYSGYTIGTYGTWFTLNVSLSMNVVAAATDRTLNSASTVEPHSAMLYLNPANTGDSSSTFGATARLVGSFAPTDQPMNLMESMLFIPSVPADDDRALAGPAEWMVVRRSLVTLDGTECNKIGVSYEAFAAQGNACNLQSGSCLNSQLEDLRTDDMTTIANRGVGQYMATSLGDFAVERFLEGGASATSSPYITYVASSPSSTMVTITISADDLQYIVSVATGKIVSASLNKETLEMSTKDGILTASVMNTGSLSARFMVGVLNCTDGVMAMAAQSASIREAETRSFQFRVYMETVGDNGTANCTVVLRDAEERIVDTATVAWAVLAVQQTNGTQGGGTGNYGGSAVEEESAATCSACKLLDFSCAFGRTCVMLVIKDFLIVAGIIVGLLLVLRVSKAFCGTCCCGFLHFLICCPSKTKEEGESHDRDRSKMRHSPTTSLPPPPSPPPLLHTYAAAPPFTTPYFSCYPRPPIVGTAMTAPYGCEPFSGLYLSAPAPQSEYEQHLPPYSHPHPHHPFATSAPQSFAYHSRSREGSGRHMRVDPFASPASSAFPSPMSSLRGGPAPTSASSFSSRMSWRSSRSYMSPFGSNRSRQSGEATVPIY